MSTERIVVGVDVGTTKICTLVGEIGADETIRIIGVGIEPSQGMSKGTVVDVALATEAVRASKRQAERTSGYEIGRAYVSVAGKHIHSVNSRGVTGLSPNRGAVEPDDVERALEAAQAIALPHNREIIHVIPRTFTVDGQENIRNPLGLHAYRLEVEAYIITAAASSLRNLEKCINDAGLEVDRFVLNPLASAESVLTQAERESGVVLIDIGGGTTDIAVVIEGTVWHTAVIEVGGNHITNDIAHVLHLPVSEAERIKIDYGNSRPDTVPTDQIVTIQPFGEDMPTQLLAYDLAQIIEARVDEIFTLVVQELKRSGYDGLLPAGAVLTGGTSALKNIRHNASAILHMPARIAHPEKITGLVDKLKIPQHATGVGLLQFARRLDSGMADSLGTSPRRGRRSGGLAVGDKIGNLLKRLLPDE
ncbi:MAG TPA: cell division protein FtsA [Aggregatilineales bacterium]|nr:cell division protein FtsA [Aggregatilineales bacterium]